MKSRLFRKRRRRVPKPKPKLRLDGFTAAELGAKVGVSVRASCHCLHPHCCS